MTHRVHDKEPQTTGRDVTSGRGGLRELLGLTLVAGAAVLFVVRPEWYEAGVHIVATRAASMVH